MESVKEYWQNKYFLFGMVLCLIGTISGALGAVTAGVIIEAVGIGFILVSIYQITSNEDNETSLAH